MCNESFRCLTQLILREFFRCVERDHKRLQAVVCQTHKLTVCGVVSSLMSLNAGDLMKLGSLKLFTKNYTNSSELLQIPQFLRITTE